MDRFDELAAECRNAVKRYVRYKISSKADGDDILQEVWLTAFEQFDRIADKSRFKGYVIGIARNKIRNYYRDRRDDVSFDELPENAQKYVRYIEKEMGCPIEYVSVGAERDAYIKMF